MKFPSIQEIYSRFKTNSHITTDSRKIPVGSVFFALRGGNFNGNNFAESALQQGCSYAVIDDETKYFNNGNYILVKDCLLTLQELAKYHRTQLKIPFIAITGSNGKTTTKELIKSILSEKYKVLATSGNLNNHIGVPLTLLSITPDIEIAVIEIGANHIGEIAMLCEIAQPDYGIITNIGKAHIGEFGSFENIVKAKTEMYDFVGTKNGKLFINSENELLMSESKGIEKITYGILQKDFCTCQCIDSNPFLKIEYENEIISSRLIGKYNFENVAAAICVGKYFGIDNKKIKEALETYTPSNNRSQVVRTNNNTLILDAYNANPSSMRAAIENFYEMKEENKWLILGDMLELGEYEIQEHKNILKLIYEKKFQNVIMVGERFSKAMSKLKISFSNLFLFKNSDELVSKIKTLPFGEGKGGVSSLILIKGSRGIKLEKIVEFL
ncbi:MAG: UDP-N-acetylmuramoyl-tripeptide--D-alanyl-D-alanine ligase [Bacteroidetes bacterium]|nr:UDP-N-acetylmuramoyl-tripeptide--D-alanyl-D-alanine ligase [Bacteroidota bacterium]